jgi:arylsulfatase A-like enzyme
VASWLRAGIFASGAGFDFSVGTAGNPNATKHEGPQFYRGKELVRELPGAPITSPVYAREACGFIESQKENPWFLYVAFNAVHHPNVASESVLARFPDLKKRERDYAAVLAEADDAIGTAMEKLRALGLEENTLIFCISDNGDSSPYANPIETHPHPSAVVHQRLRRRRREETEHHLHPRR